MIPDHLRNSRSCWCEPVAVISSLTDHATILTVPMTHDDLRGSLTPSPSTPLDPDCPTWPFHVPLIHHQNLLNVNPTVVDCEVSHRTRVGHQSAALQSLHFLHCYLHLHCYRHVNSLQEMSWRVPRNLIAVVACHASPSQHSWPSPRQVNVSMLCWA